MGAAVASCCVSREGGAELQADLFDERQEVRRLREDLTRTQGELINLSQRILGKIDKLSEQECCRSHRCPVCGGGTASALAQPWHSLGTDSAGDSENEDVLLGEHGKEPLGVGRAEVRIPCRKASDTLLEKVAQLQSARTKGRAARPALPRLDLAQAQAMPTLLARPANAACPEDATAGSWNGRERCKPEAYDLCATCQHFRMDTVSVSRSHDVGSESIERELLTEDAPQRCSRGYRLSPRLQDSHRSSAETPQPEPDGEVMPSSSRGGGNTPGLGKASPRIYRMSPLAPAELPTVTPPPSARAR